MSVTTEVAGLYKADPVHSFVGFAVPHMGVGRFRGSFQEVEATLDARGPNPTLKGSARVESISIALPPELRGHVLSEEFFGAEHNPEIQFESSSFDLGPDASVTLVGQLTIRGNTRPVTATGTYRPPTEDNYGLVRVGIDLEATIDRREWGMNWQAPLPGGGEALGNDVTLTLSLELIRESSEA